LEYLSVDECVIYVHLSQSQTPERIMSLLYLCLTTFTSWQAVWFSSFKQWDTTRSYLANLMLLMWASLIYATSTNVCLFSTQNIIFLSIFVTYYRSNVHYIGILSLFPIPTAVINCTLPHTEDLTDQHSLAW